MVKGSYTSSEQELLRNLNAITSAFSFLGASYIIANYYIFPSLRTFAFKLVLLVAIGDIISGFGNFLVSDKDDAVCFLQGLIIQFGDMVSFGWVTVIAWTIFYVLRRNTPITQADLDRWFVRMNFVVWSLAVLLTLIPVGTYGPANGVCWINENKNGGEVMRWICFYTPLWSVITFLMYVYSQIWRKLDAMFRKGTLVQGVSTGNVTVNEKTTHTQVQLQVQQNGVSAPTTSTIPNPQLQKSDSDLLATRSDSNIRGIADKKIHHRSESDEEGSKLDVVGNVNVGNTNPTSAATTANTTTTGITINTAAATTIVTKGDESPKETQDVGSGSGSGLLLRIQFFPIILFFCYLSATIRELYQLITGDTAPFVLAALDTVTSALLGTCNAIAYGGIPAVREKDKAFINRWWTKFVTCCCSCNCTPTTKTNEPEVR